ncbi:hypothetical protein RJ55_07196 [Drechmeria coniospora]|nr:hypothetical protein RJ55_07196 [Drechmeria coniospora]
MLFKTGYCSNKLPFSLEFRVKRSNTDYAAAFQLKMQKKYRGGSPRIKKSIYAIGSLPKARWGYRPYINN